MTHLLTPLCPLEDGKRAFDQPTRHLFAVVRRETWRSQVLACYSFGYESPRNLDA